MAKIDYRAEARYIATVAARLGKIDHAAGAMRGVAKMTHAHWSQMINERGTVWFATVFPAVCVWNAALTPEERKAITPYDDKE